jgi:hypothetical protein
MTPLAVPSLCELRHKIFFENRSLSGVHRGVMHTRELLSAPPHVDDKITRNISAGVRKSLRKQAEMPW